MRKVDPADATNYLTKSEEFLEVASLQQGMQSITVP